MYPWYQNFGYDYPLHRDDELGIQRIYGTIPSVFFLFGYHIVLSSIHFVYLFHDPHESF